MKEQPEKAKKRPPRDHSLRVLNFKKGLLAFFCLITLALLCFAGYLLYLRQTENAVVTAVVAGLSALLTVLPARTLYREQWYLDKARVSLGEYAEEVSLERKVVTEPDHFRMMCLFPTSSDDSAFSFSNRISARCRGRKLTLTDVTVPLAGGDLLYGCLIQLEMPRAPLSRFRMIGSTIADEEELTPFFRRQHKLLKAEAPWILDMAVYADQTLSAQEQDQLNGLLLGDGEDLAVAIEGRMLYCFAAGKSSLTPPRRLPGFVKREHLLPLTIPQIPKLLDYAFDTVDLRANANAGDFDEVSARKDAGIQGEILRPRVKQDQPTPPPAEPPREKLPEGALETERLILRPVRFEDAEEIFSAWARDPDVAVYLPWYPHANPEETRRAVDQWVRESRNASSFRLVLTLKESKALIGLIEAAAWYDGIPELRYILAKPYWNRDYMTEACMAATKELFRRGLPAVLIQADVENAPANAVAEKCGYTFIGIQQRQLSPVKPWMVTVRWYRAEARNWAGMSSQF